MVMDLIDPIGTIAVGMAVTLPTATKVFRLGKVVLRLSKKNVDSSVLPPALYALAKTMPLDSRPRAFVCSGFSCSAPLNSPEALNDFLQSNQK